jgi:hypothetical protein
MRKYSKLSVILPVVAGMLAAGNAYAQNIDDSFFNRTGDGILVSQYMQKLDRNAKISIDSLLRGGNVTKRYVIDAVAGINEIIKRLNSPRAKEFYSEEQRKNLIDRYQSFLYEINREKRSPNYKKSLEVLSKAAEDGVIEPAEIADVEDGVYMLIKKGKDKDKKNYGVFALARIIGKVQETLKIPGKKTDEEKKEYEEIKKEVLEENPEERMQYTNLPEPPAPEETPKIEGVDLAKEERTKKEKSKDLEKKTEEPKKIQEEKKSDFEICFDITGCPGLLGITTDADGNLVPTNMLPAYGGFVGGRIVVAGRLNDEFSLGGSLKGAGGFPETIGSVDTSATPTSTGRHFVANKTNQDFVELGAGLEALLGKGPIKLIFGIDGGLWIYNQKGSAGWVKGGNYVEPPNTEGPEAIFNLSGGVYLGCKLDWLRLILGWDSRKGFYGEAGVSAPVGIQN